MITTAFAGVVTALEHLAARCREQQLDPTKIIPMLMSGGTGTISEEQQDVATSSAMAGDPLFVRTSRELIEALDRGDTNAIDAALAPSFIYFDGSRIKDRTAILTSIKQRASTVPYVSERIWHEERVLQNGEGNLFLGKVHETQGGNDTHGGYVYEGWYVLQWVLVQGAWRVQLFTWQMESTDREWWNDTFRKGRGFSQEPNSLLTKIVESLLPGEALDLAMGQGRNALYLASKGWSVTGVDSSDEGVRIAREEASNRRVTLQIVHTDIDHWAFGEDRFDLVTLIYAGDNASWIAKIRSSLRIGGVVVVEGWAKVHPDSAEGFSEGQLARLFEDYEILLDEVVDNEVPDWACDTGKLVRFVARKLHS